MWPILSVNAFPKGSCMKPWNCIIPWRTSCLRIKQRSSGQAQRTLRPRYVPVFLELVTDFGENTHALEAEQLMQPGRSGIRQRVTSNDAVDILARQHLEQSGI